MSEPKSKTGKKIAPPKGTRDAYPEDVLRRRYVTQAWRDAAIRCGFDEIEGPTFEAAELYAVKSGDGILGELFQAFSGKSPDEVEQVQREGKAPYALRPEFTPTLARMYAAKAGSLPSPCKWFTAGPYFRAERPQRGRLREFLQWNCDVIGLQSDPDEVEDARRALMDAESLLPIKHLIEQLGLSRFLGHTTEDLRVRIGDRRYIDSRLLACGVLADQLEAVRNVADKKSDYKDGEFVPALIAAGVPEDQARDAAITFEQWIPFKSSYKDFITSLGRAYDTDRVGFDTYNLQQLYHSINALDLQDVAVFESEITRGLAYYTGTVFELTSPGERAVAGGGRYDNLIELFGGPPTPACGFGMGDVVLSNLLDDKGLFPQGAELMEAVSRAPASVRPEVFVIHNGSDDAREHVRPLVAALRRGVESGAHQDLGSDARPWSASRYDAASGGVRPVHARQSYKATGNPGKLFADGVKQHARFVVEVGQGEGCTLKSIDRNETVTHPSGSEWTADPTSEAYVGRALVDALGG